MVHIDLGNVGDVTKPVGTLIEKVSGAVGILYEPTRKVRDAKAEAKAIMILAEARKAACDIEEIGEAERQLQIRTLGRLLIEEDRSQRNMEAILLAAIPEIKQDAPTDKVEEDWLANFFDKCRLTSDTEMQSVWSRILAGESNSPGRFSKRTVNFVASLEKEDAEYFAALCNYSVIMFGHARPLIYEEDHEIYKLSGLNNSVFNHLESIGLISYGLATQYFQNVPRFVQLFYGDKTVAVEYSGDNANSLTAGHAMFTQIGMQLFTICERKEVPGFAEYVAEVIKPPQGGSVAIHQTGTVGF